MTKIINIINVGEYIPILDQLPILRYNLDVLLFVLIDLDTIPLTTTYVIRNQNVMDHKREFF